MLLARPPLNHVMCVCLVRVDCTWQHPLDGRIVDSFLRGLGGTDFPELIVWAIRRWYGVLCWSICHFVLQRTNTFIRRFPRTCVSLGFCRHAIDSMVSAVVATAFAITLQLLCVPGCVCARAVATQGQEQVFGRTDVYVINGDFV